MWPLGCGCTLLGAGLCPWILLARLWLCLCLPPGPAALPGAGPCPPLPGSPLGSTALSCSQFLKESLASLSLPLYWQLLLPGTWFLLALGLKMQATHPRLRTLCLESAFTAQYWVVCLLLHPPAGLRPLEAQCCVFSPFPQHVVGCPASSGMSGQPAKYQMSRVQRCRLSPLYTTRGPHKPPASAARWLSLLLQRSCLWTPGHPLLQVPPHARLTIMQTL